jgi:probable phosphoglycerate mutase
MFEMNIFENTNSLQILLVKAGSTELDNQGRITGALDIPLSETGEEQARDAAKDLESHRIDAIYSACCLAAKQTAEEIARKIKARVRTEESWKNLDYGLWHGKSIEELKENQPKLYRQWQDNPGSVCPPGGETFDDVKSRVASSLKKIRKKHKSGTIALVAPEPLYCIIRSELESNTSSASESTKQNSIRWEAIELAVA